ncbi:hypothetical protein NQ318_008021 [Aromia moschata]|uniref:Uncharacterized protein n=1 Tax=Aromia moschata TaxID=1265417 RepID=A0AAV8XJY8_9CUCU|nr:hypothetical protein NQ318_008021 [Aromia moschata]
MRIHGMKVADCYNKDFYSFPKCISTDVEMKDTFADMDSLSTLDLSVNGLTKLPSTVLQLPSLKSLYLRQHMNINIANEWKKSSPYQAR